MRQTEPALLTIFRVRHRGELDTQRLLDGPVIVESKPGETLIGAADAEAETKLGSAPAVHAVERLGRAILLPEAG
jgi:hypothetical protein